MATRLRPAHRRLTLLVGIALFASACGGGSTASNDPSELGLAGDDTTATTAESTTTEVAGSDADRVASYCAAAVEFDMAEKAINFEADFGPENAERLAGAWQAFLNESESVVPAQIAADYDQAAVGIQALIDALEENDYDYFAAFAAMDPALLESDEIDAANDRLEEFGADVCGITDVADGDSDAMTDIDDDAMGDEVLSDADIELIAGLLETEVGRQLFIEGMMEDSSLTEDQATCFVETADLETLFSFSTGTSAENAALVGLFETLSECDIDVDAFSG